MHDGDGEHSGVLIIDGQQRQHHMVRCAQMVRHNKVRSPTVDLDMHLRFANDAHQTVIKAITDHIRFEFGTKTIVDSFI